MGELKLISDFNLDAISLSSIYIDEYMPANNESQVKIYLYLIRNLSTGIPVSVASIADAFNYSTSDVERALFFMQKQGLMSLEQSKGSIVGLHLLPLTKKSNDVITFTKRPEYKSEYKPDYSEYKIEKPKPMENKVKPEIEQLLFVAEQYIGKSLSPSDIKSLTYIYETLGLNEDVVEYLIEYCVSLKKKSFRYIENVASDWADCGVKTVSDAKALTGSCPKEVYEVFKAFGIKAGSRKPSYSEVWFVNKWTQEFGFDNEVIKKACEITVDKTHCVSFEYANAILTDWNKKGVKTVDDIDKLNNSGRRAIQNKGKKSSALKHENQREYDYNELEKLLLNN